MGQVLVAIETFHAAVPVLPEAVRCSDVEALPLSLSGSDLAGRFRRWRGRSGRRYLFSIFPLVTSRPLDDCPSYADCIILAVRRDAGGSRAILHVGEAGPLPELVLGGEILRSAVAAGANEIHMHLLAQTAADRQAIVDDLRG